MTKLNLDLKQQKIVKELIPEKQGKLFQTLDGRISVSEESRQGQKFWIADIPLVSKNPQEESLLDPPHFVSTFRIERGAKQDYLVVDPQLYCGGATKLCSDLTPKVVRWRDNVRGNKAVASFIQEIIKEDPAHLNIVSSAEFLAIQSRPEEMTGLSWGDWAILGGGVLATAGGLGVLVTLLKKRRALQAAQKPVTFFIGRAPGEGGLDTRGGTELEKYISRRQVEIIYEPKTGKYLARHLGMSPTYLQHPHQYESKLSGAFSSELKPGDCLVVRAPDGGELLKIQFHPEPQDVNPRLAFTVARAPARTDTSPPSNQGVSVPLSTSKDPPPLPPPPESLEENRVAAPKSPGLLHGMSPQEREGLLKRYHQEVAELSECLTMEGEGSSRPAFLILYSSRLGQIRELLDQKDLNLKVASEEEFQLALEYARLKIPLIKGYRTLEKERADKNRDKYSTEKLIEQATEKKDSIQETQLKLYREHLRQRIEEIDGMLPQWERLVRDFHPFDLIHEMNVLRNEKKIRTTPPSVKAWQATRAQENNKKIERLEASLEYVPKTDRDWVRWAIDQLEYEKAHPSVPVSVETRAKLATVVQYATLLTDEPKIKKHRETQTKMENAYRFRGTDPAYRKQLGTEKASLEKDLQSSPRAPFKLAELFEGADKLSSPEGHSTSQEGPSPERAHPEIHPEDVTRKPGRGPGGGSQSEIRREDPLDVLKGPEELRELFEIGKGPGRIHR